MAKSVKIEGRGAMMLKTYRFPQPLGTRGSQLDLTGWQMRALPKAAKSHQHIEMRIRILAVHLKAGVTKIRRKNMSTETFAETREHPCRMETTKTT